MYYGVFKHHLPSTGEIVASSSQPGTNFTGETGTKGYV